MAARKCPPPKRGGVKETLIAILASFLCLSHGCMIDRLNPRDNPVYNFCVSSLSQRRLSIWNKQIFQINC